MQAPELSWSTLRRALRKPPSVVIRQLWMLGKARWDRRQVHSVHAQWRIDKLLVLAGGQDIQQLWADLLEAPFPGQGAAATIQANFPQERSRILDLAERALAGEVDLLGSGPTKLPDPIPWSTDFKTGFTWPPAYCHDIPYADLDKPNDVKVPWELSRFQWALPLGQAYALTGEDRYVEGFAALLEQWQGANPYAWTVNWSCTMDVALRAISIIWLIQVTRDSMTWTPERKARALELLYSHGYFISRNLEASDINGNHYLADAAGLIFCGALFRGIGESDRWLTAGRKILESELPRQIHADGVDHEASIPYHRLVLELALIPALLLDARGLGLSSSSREILRRMAQFTAAYTSPDGGCPRQGDADDGRCLALGGQPLEDHRYLCHAVGTWLGDDALLAAASQPWAEVVWWLGPKAVPATWPPPRKTGSVLFPAGGVAVLKNPSFHVVADVGPVGLRGRGGHGHNDATGFEAWLAGERVISDRGAWVYTADAKGRNEFRATASHNVFQVDDLELNRFMDPLNLWQLQDDARPWVTAFAAEDSGGLVAASHRGFEAAGIAYSRSWRLDSSELVVEDRIQGASPERTFHQRLWLAEGVRASCAPENSLQLQTPSGRIHALGWSATSLWEFLLEPAELSPSYGRRIACLRLHWILRQPSADETFALRLRHEPSPC